MLVKSAGAEPHRAIPAEIILWIWCRVRVCLNRYAIRFSCLAGETVAAEVSARSPRSSSSEVTENSSAMTGMRARSGDVSFRSQRLILFFGDVELFCQLPLSQAVGLA